jgi:pilus assembly protein CpaC
MKRAAWAVLIAFAFIIAPPSGWAPANAGDEIVIGAGTTEAVPVHLPVFKSKLVRLPADVRDVMVANAKVADVVMKTPRLAYVVGTTIGFTNVVFLDANGEKVAGLDLDVEIDIDSIGRALAAALPDEDITVTSANWDIILTGTVSTPEAAANAAQVAQLFLMSTDPPAVVVNLLGSRTKSQVLLKVRVSEMSRAVIKQFGFDLSARFRSGDTTFGVVNSTGVGAGGIGTLTSGVEVLEGGNAVFQGLRAVFDQLEADGLVKTLAEPSVTAISGETAKILVGGEFPVPVGTTENTITIEFKEFGIALNFTPVVLSETAINLQVQTEVSQLATGGAFTDELTGLTIPALTVRRASTTVNLPSGGSLVIAGLLQNDIRNSIDGFPGLKDIPILGTLFRSVDFARNETELVITVTPYLVRPVGDSALNLPTDGFAPASDVDLYFLGRLHGTYAPSETHGATGYEGPIGYILE